MPYSEKARQRAVERKKIRAESQARQKKLLQQMQEEERERMAQNTALENLPDNEEESGENGTQSATEGNWYFRKLGG